MAAIKKFDIILFGFKPGNRNKSKGNGAGLA